MPSMKLSSAAVSSAQFDDRRQSLAGSTRFSATVMLGTSVKCW